MTHFHTRIGLVVWLLFWLMFWAAAIFVATGCEYEPRMHINIPNAAPLKIQVLGFSGCPGQPVLKERLQLALKQSNIDATVEDIDLGRLPATDPRLGWGSPTILVDGRDLFGVPRKSGPELTCRGYNNGIWPSEDELQVQLLSFVRRQASE
jgi:hypothetical protein